MPWTPKAAASIVSKYSSIPHDIILTEQEMGAIKWMMRKAMLGRVADDTTEVIRGLLAKLKPHVGGLDDK